MASNGYVFGKNYGVSSRRLACTLYFGGQLSHDYKFSIGEENPYEVFVSVTSFKVREE